MLGRHVSNHFIGKVGVCHLDRVRIVRVRRFTHEIQYSTRWHDSVRIEVVATFDAGDGDVDARREKAVLPRRSQQQ